MGAEAQDYCERLYDPSNPETRDVYLSLLKVYLQPPDASAPMTMQALSLMSKHFERLDPAKALDILPPTTPLRSLQPFFESAFRRHCELSKAQQISKALVKADHVAVLHDYHVRRSRSVQVTAGRKCKVSGKKVGTSAFVVYPNNVVVLLGEKPHPHICPVTGRDFKEAPWE
uniref:Vacuolar sorting protein 39/Transforming growth factor beta receptor-associated zinc finger domain-containing protein n=1 Tax=Hemiselmis andersenii TaxID=464988 RepID=A0A7S1GX58_HEMAN|mmetsp:Transcript_2088/g.4856  ORF Transcript_2088/g.4856 Transcript_2088/m.4856 type:complete len:172 (+) Transcript_2088:2-517(+)